MARPRRYVEGARASAVADMSAAALDSLGTGAEAAASSGADPFEVDVQAATGGAAVVAADTPTKDHKSENFPVASWLIAARLRPLVLAFYRFARRADDIADRPGAAPEARLAQLEAMRLTLAGTAAVSPEAATLLAALGARGLTPVHGFKLLEAFRRDVSKSRYANWAELIDYCWYSAMPVGRFMLDVHGEDRALWPASDALCAALQVINHLQDCRQDYAAMDRVYVPADALAAAGLDAGALGLQPPPPALASVIRGLLPCVEALLTEAAPFADGIRDTGLALEVAVIHRLAVDLTVRLRTDPLGPRLHHRKSEVLRLALSAIGALALRRFSIKARRTRARGPTP